MGAKAMAGVAVVLALGAAGYLGGTAYTAHRVDHQLQLLRDGTLARESQGTMDIVDLKASPGFFSRTVDGTLVVSLPGEKPLRFPLELVVHQAPTLSALASATLVVRAPTAGTLHQVLGTLHAPYLMHAEGSYAFDGAMRMRMSVPPLRGKLQQLRVDWGGETVSLSGRDSPRRDWRSQLRGSALHLDNATQDLHLTLGAWSASAQSDVAADRSEGSLHETLGIAASSVRKARQDVLSMKQASLRLDAAWNLAAAQSPGLSLKTLDLKVTMVQPAGDIALHADGMLPATRQQLEQADQQPLRAMSLLQGLVAHGSVSLPQALAAANPTLSALASQYGRRDGANVRIDATFAGGRLLVNGQPLG